jgi:hypothetical protein
MIATKPLTPTIHHRARQARVRRGGRASAVVKPSRWAASAVDAVEAVDAAVAIGAVTVMPP